MPRTRQVAPPRDRSQTPPPPKLEWHSTVSHDHQGRPFQSIWYGADTFNPPGFSWQVYFTASGLNDDPVGIATFLGGWEIADYEATFAIYVPLPSTYACIEHQKMERHHRKTHNHLIQHAHAVTTIPECYGHAPELVGFIIIIDTPEWKSEGRGPLFASFDIRPRALAVVDHGLNAEDAGIFEQIEMSFRRQRRLHNLGHDLFFLWVASGGHDREEYNAEALKKLSAYPEPRSVAYPSGNTPGLEDEFAVQSFEHESGLRQLQITTETAEETATYMVYSIYTIFQNAQPSEYSVEETARSFTAAIVSHLPLPTPNISSQSFGPLPDIISENRRYPHHGIEAAGAAFMEEPDYPTFLVVVDKLTGPMTKKVSCLFGMIVDRSLEMCCRDKPKRQWLGGCRA